MTEKSEIFLSVHTNFIAYYNHVDMIFFLFQIIQQYERGVIVRLGRDRSKTLLKPGMSLFYCLKCSAWVVGETYMF